MQKPTAANAVADFSVTEEMGSADFTTSHDNPAEVGFITVTKKTRGDIRAVKSSEKKRVKTKALFVSRCTPDVSARDAENSLKEQPKLSSTA
jgi:hypothetical protein